MHAVLLAAALSIAAGTFAKHGPAVGTTSSEAAPAAAQSTLPAPVQASTRFAVRLVTPIRANYVAPGDSIVARLIDPLRAPDGRIAASAGSVLIGHVAGTSVGRREAVQLDFDVVDSVLGPALIHATLDGPQRFANAIALPVSTAERAGYDALFFAPAGRPPPVIGGGPPEPTLPGFEPRHILDVPANAVLRLILTEPLSLQ